MKRLKLALVPLLAACIALPVAVEVAFRLKRMEFRMVQKPKIWVHRGGRPENSLEGIEWALREGAPGIELDVYFDKQTGKFLVKHDENQASALTLDKVFSVHGGSGISFWIDLKNLTREDGPAIAREFRELSEKYRLQDRLIVESTEGKALAALSSSGIRTSFWIKPSSLSRIGWLREFPIRLRIVLGNFNAISMSYTDYTPAVKNRFANLPVLLFTVNEPDLLRQLDGDPNVRVILTDLPPSEIYGRN